MDLTLFKKYSQENLDLLKAIEVSAIELHKRVNQSYGVNLSYGFHLEMTASFVRKYGYLVAEESRDIVLLYAAAFYHDSIEDARLTYHNVIATFSTLNMDEALATRAADIVYALTNLRGKTREERANDEYYALIRETPFASFLKMCDRLANVTYSTRFGDADRMAGVYREEVEHFIAAVTFQAVPPVPEAMIGELRSLLATD